MFGLFINDSILTLQTVNSLDLSKVKESSVKMTNVEVFGKVRLSCSSTFSRSFDVQFLQILKLSS